MMSSLVVKISGKVSGMLLWTVLAACLMSCSREELEYQVPEDADMLVTFGYAMPEMNVVTRSDMSDSDAMALNSLWVGIFDASDGKLIESETYTNVKSDDFHKFEQLETSFEAQAGQYHIVAVGNIHGNRGVATIKDVSKTGELAVLLADVTTWEEYRSLAVMLPASGTIEAAGGNLPMSGVYYDCTHGAEPRPEDWEALSDTPVYIYPTGMTADGNRISVRLPGAVHLRRMISQVRFNIKARNADILEIEPYSWQVHNVPETGWVHERGGEGRNAGDVVTAVNADRKDNYASSPVYGGADFHSGADGFQTFDFWQMENKRTGIGGDSYKDREQEIPLESGLNSGFYTCLTDRTDGSDFNNYASYVTIKCRIAYIDRTAGSETIGGIEIQGGMERTADVTYCVHLGYCEGDSEAARTKDFSCRRNTRYTYNLYVTGVHNLMVEAIADEEVQPGAEGLVSDVSETYIELDAHYHAFNVQMTPAERNGFSFLIHAWYDNQLHRIELKPDGTHNVPEDELSDEYKFYSWVEFRPTVDQYTIARYYPYGMNPASDDTNTKKTFRLLDLRSDKKEYSAINDGNWYTVFINEHVYEDGPDESGGNWKKYVNMNSDRRLWLKVTDHKSPDGETIYLRSKYALSQKSIQTYYDPAKSSNAIGVEHKNESLGYALRKDGTSGLSAVNGRYNAVRFSNAASGNSDWGTYVLSNAYWTPDINNQSYVSESHDAYMPGVSSTGASGSAVATDPAGTGSTVISVNNACMNRNRDLNGNGKIDVDEIRWFVPASSQYIRIILGRNSLHTPIMDYDGISSLPAGKVGDDKGNSRLHLGTSNNKQLWAEEGLSVGDLVDGGAWHVRCIRYLGTNLSDYGSAGAGVITPAYVLDGNVVKMTYYDEKSVRQNRRTTPFPRHFVNNQDYNRVYRAFEIAPSNVVLNGEDGNPARPGSNEAWQSYLYNDDGTPKNNPCAGRFSGDGWRVPNQKECSIMRDLGKLEFVEWETYWYWPFNNRDDVVTNHLSCTQEYYDANGVGDGKGLHRFLGANKDISKAMDDGSIWERPENGLPTDRTPRERGLAIRCVRDVEP